MAARGRLQTLRAPNSRRTARSATGGLRAHLDPAHAFDALQVLAVQPPAAAVVLGVLAPLTRADVVQAGLMLAQEAADELEEVAAYVPSEGGYAQTSYYGTLGLYAVSLPGLYSTITRAVKFKPISKVYEAPGPAAGREVRQTAGEISAYFRAMNFQPEPKEDKIVFKGMMGRSRGQAAFLTFITFLSLASLGIVLTIS